MHTNFEINPVLAVGILIIIGYLGGMAAKKVKFPRISGYIFIGMLLGVSFLNIISQEVIHGGLNIITDITLGIIAYLVGGSMSIDSLRRVRKDIAWISFFEALGAWIFVTFIILFIGPLIVRLNIEDIIFSQTYLPMAIILGAVSLATAPAATIAIIREYKSRGPLTTILMGVVTLDDAYAIIGTAIALSIANAFIMGIESFSVYQLMITPLFEIIGSVVIGAIFAVALMGMSRFAPNKQALLAIVFGMIMLSAGVAKLLRLSPLLVNIAMGFVIVNRMSYNKDMFLVIDDIEDLIFAAFFTLAGAHLNLAIMRVAWTLSLLIIIGRFSGKLVGSRLGASISGAPPQVKKYLGFGLLPKAGVTLGLILLASEIPAFQGFGEVMVNGVLGSVVINELISPPLVKFAIFKAGEATVSP
ncbi:cation:proton antiporter [bacterium]|nr:cation:proton antiporter [bacterium]